VGDTLRRVRDLRGFFILSLFLVSPALISKGRWAGSERGWEKDGQVAFDKGLERNKLEALGGPFLYSTIKRLPVDSCKEGMAWSSLSNKAR
jgi:hypothetical protein